MTAGTPSREALAAVAALRPERAGIRRIGLLGGSFNPAHDGHLHISRLALDRLHLHEVWWLVSPQNPLKPSRGMTLLARRLAAARTAARGERIWVSDLERLLGTRYSVDTMGALAAAFPRTRFVWLMGADLMIQMPRWRAWERLFEAVPVAVFDRDSYAGEALEGPVARRFAHRRVAASQATRLALARPPAWAFFATPVLAISATEIRARRAGLEGRHGRAAGNGKGEVGP